MNAHGLAPEPTARHPLHGINSASTEKAYVQSANRLCECGAWDEALLVENFRILDEFDLEFDLDITGFSTTEIDRLLGFEIVDEADEDGALVTFGTGPGVSRPGDLWELGDHRLFCGDALEAASYATLLGDRRARMVLTDPPYNVRARHIGRTAARVHGDFVVGAGEMGDAGFVDFLAAVFGQVRRAPAVARA
jgi:hypothetical protein